MSKIIQLLILLSLGTTFTYAIDLNSTNEIITKATQATKALEVELNSVINNVEEIPHELVIPVEDSIVLESNATMVEIENIEFVEMLPKESVVFEENTSLVLSQTIILESNSSSLEDNSSNIHEGKEVSVEKGDPRKGKNIFKYVLKEDCNMSAYKFAEKHSQEEWIEVLEENKLKETIFETCPNVEKYYQDRWTDDLYQFFYEASNEDEIPEC